MRLLLLLLLAVPAFADEAADMMLIESLRNDYRHQQLMTELRRQRETPVQAPTPQGAPTVIYMQPSAPARHRMPPACDTPGGYISRACIQQLKATRAAP